MSLAALKVSEAQLLERSSASLQANLNTVSYYLQSSNMIHSTWLAQTEASNHIILSIEENNIPLLFKGSHQSLSPRKALVAKAKEIATTAYSVDFSLGAPSNTFAITAFEFHTPLGEHFLVATTILPIRDSYFQVMILKDMKIDNNQMNQMRLFFGGLTLLCTLSLCYFSWWFSGKAIAPIEVSQQKQRQFIAAASHELNTPLTVIQTNSSALKLPQVTDPDVFIDAITSECKHMGRLVHDLLLLANADASSNWSFKAEPLELDTLLLELYDHFYCYSVENNHPLSLVLPEESVEPISADKDRLQQILTILLDNAFTYTPSGTPITLSLAFSTQSACIQVIDHGPGISSEHKKYIFDRFYRIDQSRHEKSHYGLGLSIADEIIKLHHGKLSLEDTEGGGCTFCITLPRFTL